MAPAANSSRTCAHSPPAVTHRRKRCSLTRPCRVASRVRSPLAGAGVASQNSVMRSSARAGVARAQTRSRAEAGRAFTWLSRRWGAPPRQGRASARAPAVVDALPWNCTRGTSPGALCQCWQGARWHGAIATHTSAELRAKADSSAGARRIGPCSPTDQLLSMRSWRACARAIARPSWRSSRPPRTSCAASSPRTPTPPTTSRRRSRPPTSRLRDHRRLPLRGHLPAVAQGHRPQPAAPGDRAPAPLAVRRRGRPREAARAVRSERGGGAELGELLAALDACLGQLAEPARRLIDGFYRERRALELELAQEHGRTRAAVAMQPVAHPRRAARLPRAQGRGVVDPGAPRRAGRPARRRGRVGGRARRAAGRRAGRAGGGRRAARGRAPAPAARGAAGGAAARRDGAPRRRDRARPSAFAARARRGRRAAPPRRPAPILVRLGGRGGAGAGARGRHPGAALRQRRSRPARTGGSRR